MSSVMRFDEWQDSNGNPVASGVGGIFTAPGSVLQVVSTNKTDTFSTASSTFVDVTGLSATITPSSASSQIMVFGFISVGPPTDQRIDVQLMRASTAIAIGDSSGVTGISVDGASIQNRLNAVALAPSILDSPATTSAVTYKFQVKTTSGTGYVNRRESSATPVVFSSITLMEIAG